MQRGRTHMDQSMKARENQAGLKDDSWGDPSFPLSCCFLISSFKQQARFTAAISFLLSLESAVIVRIG